MSENDEGSDNPRDKDKEDLSLKGDLPPKKRLPGLKGLAAKMGIFCASVALALVAIEIFLRLFIPQPLAGVMFSYNPSFGFWNRPSLVNKPFQSEQGRPFYKVSTDPHGFRGVEPVAILKPPNKKRILVIGDSFTFGVGVGDSETFPAQLQSHLGDRYEVINAGCPGWGTENELAFWRAWRSRLKPDLLVIAFFRNDLADNTRHLIYRIKDGKPQFAPDESVARAKKFVQAIPFYTYLSEHSHLVNLVKRSVAALLTAPPAKKPADKASPVAQAPRKEQASGLQQQLDLYRILMQEILGDSRRVGVPVVLLTLAGQLDCAPNPPPEYDEVMRMAEGWVGSGLAVAAISTKVPLKVTTSKEIFQPQDGHYTAEGNRIVADLLASRIIPAWFERPSPAAKDPGK